MNTQHHYSTWLCIFCRKQYSYKEDKKHFKTVNHQNNKTVWQDTLLSHPLAKNKAQK